jgi:hypothetical protein
MKTLPAHRTSEDEPEEDEPEQSTSSGEQPNKKQRSDTSSAPSDKDDTSGENNKL